MRLANSFIPGSANLSMNCRGAAGPVPLWLPVMAALGRGGLVLDLRDIRT
ncbi:hypothetical protein N9W17_04290 [Jannaschia sp.]|nr:hypothetical protein [Jannaschia sp.]